MLQPLISVIVFACNKDKSLAECLDSLLNQIYSNLQIILVAGASNACENNICEQYAQKDKRITVIYKENSDIFTAFNVGLDLAKGDYLSFVDGNDLLELNMYDKLMQIMLRANTDIVVSGLGIISENEKTVYLARPSIKYYGKEVLQKLVQNEEINIFLNNKLFKKELWDNIYLTQCDKLEDSAIYSIFAKADSVVYINDALYNLRGAKGNAELWLPQQQGASAPIEVIDLEDKVKANLDKEVIISLTSYPKRLASLHIVLESLLSQTVRADRVILWLVKEELPGGENDIPQAVLELKQKGLELDWCENLKSFNKLLPALRKYPESIIVTSDDDMLYDKNWLRLLLDGYIFYEDVICCHRVDKMPIKNGIVPPYNTWLNHSKIKQARPSFLMLCLGVGGVLYPPRCLADNVFNIDKLNTLCPNNDDVWFWGNAVLNGTRIHLVAGAKPEPIAIENTQEIGLWNTQNKFNDATGQCIRSFLAAYPLAKRLLEAEYQTEQDNICLQEKLSLQARLDAYLDEQKQLKKQLEKYISVNERYKHQIDKDIADKETLRARLKAEKEGKLELRAKLQAEKDKLKLLQQSFKEAQSQVRCLHQSLLKEQEQNKAEQQLRQKAEEKVKCFQLELSREQELNRDLQESISFRLGRALTWAPRKARDLLR